MWLYRPREERKENFVVLSMGETPGCGSCERKCRRDAEKSRDIIKMYVRTEKSVGATG
ncbi:hypothetical protein ALC57_08230 [Trachymyrmex cornetzi]|uniref:Uncharacterized protein n=1 Tax=Trachymyrmex cornetzi TaxID=471704 RepID=A0A195E2T8_9HYME|nr:hypothetical protein ALC57_08230 [Trachymyrmex cornetzi]